MLPPERRSRPRSGARTPHLGRASVARNLCGLLTATALACVACGDSAPDPAGAPSASGGSTETSTPSAPVASGSEAVTGATSTPDTSGPPAPDPVVAPLLDNARISSNPDDPNFHRVRAALRLDGPYAEARLRIALDTTCYPFERWREETIPQGHNWPPSCDAFDRNFEILLREVGAPEGQPDFEVERAITPFGGPMDLDVDITDLANARPGDWELIVHISTWSDGAGQVSGSAGGWNISADLATVDGPPPRPIRDVIPLFNGNLTHDSPDALAAYSLDAAIDHVRLEIRTTGHGGATDLGGDCIGPAEEFCRRFHTLVHNGRTLAILQPWRDDCDTLCSLAPMPPGFRGEYCRENPTGAVQSVRAPRANWCPGDITPPFIRTDDALATPGEHTIAHEVAQIFPGGSWRTSILLYTYGP